MADVSLPPLIQHMLQPEFYPHPVIEPIRLMQTHVSYVTLTGDYAYKVKKPVDFGFLDYSTLERRQHFCEEELRLNQRAAASIYLEVLAIAQSDKGYSLGTEDTVVEYTIKMRQFPQSALLSQMFEQGDLTEALLRQLAEVIAQFHQTAKTNDYIRAFGTVANIRQSIDENYEQTESFIGGPQTQQQFQETQAYTDSFFSTQQELLQQRINQDRIRACHGDSHLNNICYWQDQLLLFDCIEFNEPFRFVDVMFDIAYIIMDLTVEGRQDLAATFLSHYVEHTGDWEGLQVLPLYVSRQSYVRAKVTSFLLGDPSIDEAEKQRASAKAAKYYTLAWSYTQPRTGRLLIMSGLSGSGKSTVARELSRKLGAIHIRSDAVRKHLAGIPPQQRGDDSLYTPEMMQKTYERLIRLGTLLAQQGYTVVLDAKFDREAMRRLAIAQAQEQAITFQVVFCDAPPEILKQRVEQREGDIADATVTVLEKQSMDPFTDAEREYVISLDTTQSLSSQLGTI
ncbi:AAA family ATPase [Oscillatoria sp. CS-180]|uniref:bifunctional aminoglycoside phosphotransferase/ATP-binding protein n=1 Tax=Oscillatoria sp. CS-180 TaxID=3021720 RepID=UPI00232B57F1|nr:bifunctional aminoglycoside phosphotransferase/ATP-binding protein [Oscillatoria sp. CS-180]MDB9525650.1 AAA family ATPase [Oscillatoria sp. CS-180]